MHRRQAQHLDAAALVASEPITIVLSEKGWVRAAKGHEIDPSGLMFRAGDGYLAAAHGRTNQPVYLFDSGGRVYALPAHDLSSARGQGEPLTGRLKPPVGALFIDLVAASEDACYLISSNAGYGFVRS